MDSEYKKMKGLAQAYLADPMDEHAKRALEEFFEPFLHQSKRKKGPKPSSLDKQEDRTATRQSYSSMAIQGAMAWALEPRYLCAYLIEGSIRRELEKEQDLKQARERNTFIEECKRDPLSYLCQCMEASLRSFSDICISSGRATDGSITDIYRPSEDGDEWVLVARKNPELMKKPEFKKTPESDLLEVYEEIKKQSDDTLVRGAVQSLPDNLRHVIDLDFYQDMTPVDIAYRLNTTTGNVAVLKYRALRGLVWHIISSCRATLEAENIQVLDLYYKGTERTKRHIATQLTCSIAEAEQRRERAVRALWRCLERRMEDCHEDQ